MADRPWWKLNRIEGRRVRLHFLAQELKTEPSSVEGLSQAAGGSRQQLPTYERVSLRTFLACLVTELEEIGFISRDCDAHSTDLWRFKQDRLVREIHGGRDGGHDGA